MPKILRLSFALLALTANPIFAAHIEHLNIQILNASAYACKLIDKNKNIPFEYTSSIVPEFIPAYSLTSPMIIRSGSETTLHYRCEGYGEVTYHIKSNAESYSKHKLSIDISPINMSSTYQTQYIGQEAQHILLRIE